MFGWIAGCVPENEKRWMIVESTTTAIVLAQWTIRYSEATLHEPLTYRIAPSRSAGPRATEMGALLSPCRSPGVDEDYDDGTDNDRGEPVDDDRGESEWDCEPTTWTDVRHAWNARPSPWTCSKCGAVWHRRQ